ncbi:PstS family phosphate ABC transporter substrate-binding protein [Desulfitibacter alkalitolerans]|uniref:PstS family phosphate ABC transporter substrate-binding protein n=1 Tax=Desulfitibacter alkalitolerans TaxID=264641 RepID=UPI000685C655|nr:substrate-binding domain-containing protein [Desulfitibacter alkalitolerans]
MKKQYMISIAVLIVMLFTSLFMGCQSKENTQNELSFTLETYPRVDGSTVTIPLSEAIAAKLTGLTVDEVRPYILHNKTHQAYLNLINKKADIIFVTSPSEEELALAAEKGVGLEIVPIVSEAFVFLTHADNPVKGLTLEQIRHIYAGYITDWAEVGGPDAAIVAYQRPVNSGSQTGFLELVMKELSPMNPPTERIAAGMGELIEAVAAYENVPDALGYSYYYFVVDMWGNEKVKLLEVDGVYPNHGTIRSGDYPVKTAYYAVIRDDEPKDSPVRQLIAWVLSKPGQDLVEEAGYVKIK